MNDYVKAAEKYQRKQENLKAGFVNTIEKLYDKYFTRQKAVEVAIGVLEDENEVLQHDLNEINKLKETI